MTECATMMMSNDDNRWIELSCCCGFADVIVADVIVADFVVQWRI